jgi:hypothetical protein
MRNPGKAYNHQMAIKIAMPTASHVMQAIITGSVLTLLTAKKWK